MADKTLLRAETLDLESSFTVVSLGSSKNCLLAIGTISVS